MSNWVKMFNPDNKYNVDKMRRQARLNQDRGVGTIIHAHKAEVECDGGIEGCEFYRPKRTE